MTEKIFSISIPDDLEQQRQFATRAALAACWACLAIHETHSQDQSKPLAPLLEALHGALLEPKGAWQNLLQTRYEELVSDLNIEKLSLEQLEQATEELFQASPVQSLLDLACLQAVTCLWSEKPLPIAQRVLEACSQASDSGWIQSRVERELKSWQGDSDPVQERYDELISPPLERPLAPSGL